ncbi:MAG: DUF2019 domain-containing protein [Bauldia sp.]|nr:DUF2019 domain-containing protein [Bauldia sp.]
MIRLAAQSTEQLVNDFVEIGLAQFDALLGLDVTRANRRYARKRALLDELRHRAGDQRHALLPLLKHKNLQVRLNAATATLALAPTAARQALEAIRASGYMPQAADAAGCLRSLDEGIFKPA